MKIINATKQNSDFLRGFSRTQEEVLDLADEVLQPNQEEIKELCAAHQAVLKEEQSALTAADISKLQTVEVAQ